MVRRTGVYYGNTGEFGSTNIPNTSLPLIIPWYACTARDTVDLLLISQALHHRRKASALDNSSKIPEIYIIVKQLVVSNRKKLTLSISQRV